MGYPLPGVHQPPAGWHRPCNLSEGPGSHLYRGFSMNRLMSPLGIPSLTVRSSSLAALTAASLAQGCATSQPTLRTASPVAQATRVASRPAPNVGSAAAAVRVAQRTEVAAEKD